MSLSFASAAAPPPTDAFVAVNGRSPADDDPAAAASGEPNGNPAKRRRINFACNYCRNRKTRCDEQKPSCRACIAAGIECVTTDRRRPGVEVQRRETKRRASRASTTTSGAYASPQSSIREADVDLVDAPGQAPVSSPSVSRGRSSSGSTKVFVDGARDSVTAISAPQHEDDQQPESGQNGAKFQGKLPVVRPSRGSTSVEILADWLDLSARRLGLRHRRGLPPPPPSSSSRSRIRALLAPEPCRFPPAGPARQLAARFFDGANVLYPLVPSRDRFQRDLETALDAAATPTPADFAGERGVAALAQLYLVWAIGFAAEPMVLDPAVDPQEYLDYCKALLGHLVVQNSAENVRAIVLLALCLHCYDDCAGAWNTLGVGVAMATSLGLHKPRSCRRRREGDDDDEERRAFWLGIYAFEKFLAFSMGRMSSIDDEECYPPYANSPETPAAPGSSSREKAFATTIDLARILSEIGRKSVIVSRKEDGVTGDALKAVIAEKVQTTGEAKLLLTRWGESVPDELRPTSDILIGSKICPFASFISVHYNNALVILSRNSLLISEEAISSGANIIARGKPWDYIVRNGQSIAANAARKMLRIVVETFDSKSNSIFPSLLAALNALAALAVHIATHPDSRVSAMDFHLIKTVSETMKEVYARLRGDRMFNSLLQKIDVILQQSTPAPSRLADTPVPETVPNQAPAEDNPWSRRNGSSSQATTTEQERWAGEAQAKEACPGPPDLSAAQMFNQNYALSGTGDFAYGALGSAMPVPGDEWSPSLSDGVGWDWACFSQLLAEQFQPQ